jgi:hypothetical protein
VPNQSLKTFVRRKVAPLQFIIPREWSAVWGLALMVHRLEDSVALKDKSGAACRKLEHLPSQHGFQLVRNSVFNGNGECCAAG